MQDCKHYLLGCNDFMVITDHRPLLGTFTKPLSEISNARLLRLREKLTDYRFSLTWCPGKSHFIADALSRSPIFDPAEEEDGQDEHAEYCTVNVVLCESIAIDPALQGIYDAAEADLDYQLIMKTLLEDKDFGKISPTHPARSYKSVWNELSVLDDLLVLDDSRIIVPVAMRKEILTLLHESHSGIVRTRKLAQQLYYWPAINADIKTMIDKCELCQRVRPSQSEPLQSYPESSGPMSSMSLDPFHHEGKHYLIMVDRYSGFPFVDKLSSQQTSSVLRTVEAHFLEHGYPRSMISDGGPQFRTEFQDYCKDHHIEYTPSSPYNSQSNGLAESSVKSMKHLMSKTTSFEDFKKRLLHWRNVPRSDSNVSPAQLFYGRRLRDSLPQLTQKEPAPKLVAGLPMLAPGYRVRLQNTISKKWDSCGTIVSMRDNGRSYFVQKDDEDSNLLRNRRFLKLIEGEREQTPAPAPSMPSSRPASSSSQIEDQVQGQEQLPKKTPTPLPPPSSTSPILRQSARLQEKEKEKRNKKKKCAKATRR
jgi:transposase InsO family protein